ncbi:hypothetical protein FDZ49_14850 [Salmonella enterica]|nr:hypothetical protein [Salmonella enterica]
MKNKLIAVSIASLMGVISSNAANASTYSAGTPVEVSANVVVPTSVTAQFSPAKDSLTVDDLQSGGVIGTVSINADTAPSGWWFNTPGTSLTSDTTSLTLKGPSDQYFRVSMPENWAFSNDNGGIMWMASDNKPSVTFDLKAVPGSTYGMVAGKYSVTLNVGTYMS